MSNETNTDNAANEANDTPKKKAARRPTRRQFAFARSIAKQTGNPIPKHAVYSGKAMSGYIAANAPKETAA